MDKSKMKNIILILFILVSVISQGQTIDAHNGVAGANIDAHDGVASGNIDQINGVTLTPSSLLDGIISWWEFDETSGTTAYDSYANNDLTIAGGAIVNQTGKMGAAIYFDSINDQLNLSSAADFTALSGVTISVWIYSTFMSSIDEYRVIVAKLHSSWASPYYQFMLRVRFGAYKAFEGNIGGTATNTASTTANNAYQTSTWQHVVLTWDGSDGAHKIYLNGSDATSGTAGTLTGTTGTATSNLTVGDETDLFANFRNWAGTIDQVIIYNRALTADEVSALNNSGNGVAFSDL